MVLCIIEWEVHDVRFAFGALLCLQPSFGLTAEAEQGCAVWGKQSSSIGSAARC